MTSCLLVASGLVPDVSGAVPTFSYRRTGHVSDYFGVQMTYLNGQSTCYQTGALPGFTPVIKNEAARYTVSCQFLTEGLTYTGIYCPAPVTSIPDGVLTISHINSRAGQPTPIPFLATFGPSPAPKAVTATAGAVATSTSTSTVTAPGSASTTTAFITGATQTATTTIIVTQTRSTTNTNYVSSCASPPPTSSSSRAVSSSASAPALSSSSSSSSSVRPSATASGVLATPSGFANSCPADNGKLISTSAGTFKITCDYDRAGTTIGPFRPGNGFLGCVNLCANTPTCLFSSYYSMDRDCYLKFGFGVPKFNQHVCGAELVSPAASSSPVPSTSSSAAASSSAAPSASASGLACPGDNGKQITVGTKIFQITCQYDRSGISAGPFFPGGGLTGCATLCADTPLCLWSTYFAGFETCHLKFGLGLAIFDGLASGLKCINHPDSSSPVAATSAPTSTAVSSPVASTDSSSSSAAASSSSTATSSSSSSAPSPSSSRSAASSSPATSSTPAASSAPSQNPLSSAPVSSGPAASSSAAAASSSSAAAAASSSSVASSSSIAASSSAAASRSSAPAQSSTSAPGASSSAPASSSLSSSAVVPSTSSTASSSPVATSDPAASSSAAAAPSSTLSSGTHTSSSAVGVSSSGSAASSAAAPTATSTSVLCPGDNGKPVDTASGAFVIECYVDRTGDDIATVYPDGGFYGCIQACVKTPKCIDLSYSPNGPCYLKETQGTPNKNDGIWGARLGSPAASTVASGSSATSSGAATSGSASSGAGSSGAASTTDSGATATSTGSAATASVVCPGSDGQTISTPGGTFVVECGTDRTGGDVSDSPVYPGSFEKCVAACGVRDSCVDVSWANGPCYLKSVAGTPNKNAGIIGGRLISGPSSSGAVSSPSGTASASSGASATSGASSSGASPSGVSSTGSSATRTSSTGASDTGTSTAGGSATSGASATGASSSGASASSRTPSTGATSAGASSAGGASSATTTSPATTSGAGAPVQTVTVTTTISGKGYQCACTPTGGLASGPAPSGAASTAAASAPAASATPGASLDCPASDGSTYTSSCGATYKIECYSDRYGDDSTYCL